MAEDDPADAAPPGAGHGQADTVVSGIADDWGDVVDQMAAMATEYRDAGWDVVELHPGDVVPQSPAEDERWGLDVVLPGDEVEALCDLVGDDPAALDEWDVYRRQAGDVVFLLVVARDDERSRAAFVPLYYRIPDAADMARAARDAGQIRVHLRPLSHDPTVTLTQPDPSLFLPE